MWRRCLAGKAKRHGATALDRLVDERVRLADGNDTVSPDSDLLFNPLQPLGWATLLSVISPSLDRALTAKQKVDCSRGTERLI